MKNEMAEVIKRLEKEGADAIRGDFAEIKPNQLSAYYGIDWISQYKWDGWFVALVVQNQVGTMYSRTKKYRVNLDCKGLTDNIYIGELIENTEWSYLFHNGQWHGKLIIFDVLFRSKNYLSEMNKLADRIKVDWIKVALTDLRSPQIVYEEAVKIGFEGVVITNLLTGEKIKVKKVIEREYIIMGYLKSTSGTAIKKGGMIAGFIYGDGKKEIGRCGSMPHELKIDMYLHPKRYLGKTVVISGKQLFKSGALRHPAFNGFRDAADKKL